MADNCSNPNLDGGIGTSRLPSIDLSKIFDNYKLSKYNTFFDSTIGKIFIKYVSDLGWTVDDLQNAANLRSIYAGLKSEIKNMLIEKYAGDGTGEWRRLSQEAGEDLHTIMENFDDFAKEHLRFSDIVRAKTFNLNEDATEDEASEGDNSDETEEDDDETNDNKGKENWDSESNAQAQIDLASNAVRIMFRILSKAIYNPTTKKTELVYDKDGLPSPAESTKVWNLLAERLNGEKDYGRFREILLSEKTRQIIPEVDQINQILRLDKPDSQKTTNEVMQFLNFMKTFAKPKIPLQSSFINTEGSFSLSDEILGNTKKIELLFNNNFSIGNVPEEYKKYIKVTASGLKLLTKQTQDDIGLPPIEGGFEVRKKFLNFLGFQFTGLHLLSPTQEENFAEMVNRTAQRLHASLTERLNIPGTQIKDPIKELKKKYGKISSEISSIKELIAFESEWSQLTPTHSARNGIGELQHLINMDSAISMTTHHLNSSATIDELMKTPSFINAKYNPLFRASLIIDWLFDENGNKRVVDAADGKPTIRTVDLTLLSAYKEQQENGKVITRLERNLSEKGKMKQDINNFATAGKTDTIRTESSFSFFVLGLGKNGVAYRFINPKGFSSEKDGFTKDSFFTRRILGYLNGELERIASFSKKKEENPTIPDAYGDFSIFSEISQATKDSLRGVTKLTADDALFKDFMQDYNKVLTREFNSIKLALNKNQLSEDELLSTQIKDSKFNLNTVIRAFVAGTTIQNIEFSILYAGDPLFAGDKVLKRAKGMSSTGNIALGISLFSTYMQGVQEQRHYNRYSLAGAMGIKPSDNSEQFSTKTLIDPISTNNGYTRPEFLDHLNASKTARDGNTLSPAELQQIVKGGNNIAIADGQGHMNLDFYREISMMFGFWNPEMEVAFQYEGLIFRKDILHLELSVDEEKDLDSLTKKIYGPESYKYGLPPIKATYWGNVINSTIDAKAYDKFSIAPILPSSARSKPELKDLMLDMIKGGYGYVKYQSGTKLFTRTPVASLKGAKPDYYSTQLFKEQIKTNNVQKKDTAIPTQGLKLVPANLINAGVPVTERVGVLYEKYKSLLKTIQKEQRIKVRDDLGFDEKMDFSPRILSKRLIRQAKNQELDSDIITSLSINKDTGQFNTDLESSGFQRQTMGLIAGILDRALRRFRFAGGDFVIVSNVHQPKLQWYKYTPEGTTPMEIRITLTPEFMKLLNKVHPDGDRIGTIERLNTLVRNKEWNTENEQSLLVFIGRVPIEGPKSMGVGKVVEFLSPTHGNIIQEPEESIKQTGLDFDYDKRKIITPQFDSYGNYLSNTPTKKRMEKILEKLNEIQDIYPELKNLADIPTEEEESYSVFINKLFGTTSKEELFKANYEATALLQEYKSLKEGVESIKSNSLLEIYKDFLTLPESFLDLVSPANTDNIRKLSEDNGANVGIDALLPILGQVFSYMYNLKAKGIFFDTKSLLATFATDNTWQQLITYAGINLNEIFNTIQYPKGKPEWTPGKINHLLLSKAEAAKITKDGKILISLRDDLEGFVKQYYNSEGINATADAAKDPFIALLRITLQNIGVVNVLRNFGVPFKRIIDFVNHPTLQYYFTLKSNGLSASEALEDMAKNKLGLKYVVKKPPEVITNIRHLAYATNSNEELIAKGLLQPGDTFTLITEPKQRPKVVITTTFYPKASIIRSLFNEIDKGVPVTDGRFSGETATIDLNKYIKNNQITPERLEFLANKDNDRQVVKQLPERKGENAQMYSDELRILANFFATEKVAYAMMDFKKYFNFDTKKVSTLTDVNMKKHLKNKILDQNLIPKEFFKKMESNSILSGFINDEFIGTIYEKIFPILANSIVQNGLSKIHNDYDTNFRTPKNKRDIRNLPFTLSDDFTSAVVFNFSYISGKKLFDYGLPLLIRNGKQATMADKLSNFKNKPFYAELSRAYPILDSFISEKQAFADETDPNGLTSPFILESIRLIKDPQETRVENEAIRRQLRNLYFHYEGDAKEEVKDFMKDLFITGIVQSGMSRTFISYQEYIPLEFKRNINGNAMNRWKSLDPIDQERFMNGLNRYFKGNNPRYFPYIQVPGRRKDSPNNNKYWSKFKYYKINTPAIITPIEEGKTKPTISLQEFQDHAQNVIREMTGNEDFVLGGNKIDFQEEQSTGYRNRTIKNASADATIAFAVDFNSAGEKLTKSSVEAQKKMYIPIHITTDNLEDYDTYNIIPIINQLNEAKAKTLNIAGNGIYTMKGKFKQEEIDDMVYNLIRRIVESPGLENKIESIRTGGQTGFDEAGAKAGMRLGIPTNVLAPKGWKFRDVNGTDISNEQQFKARFELPPSTTDTTQDGEGTPTSSIQLNINGNPIDIKCNT